MPDLDSIAGSLHLDFWCLVIIFLVYWITNIIKEKRCLSRPDVHTVAILIGILLNLFREVMNGLRFPSGIPDLSRVVLYGILFGILATGSHKLIQYLSARFGLPLYMPMDTTNTSDTTNDTNPLAPRGEEETFTILAPSKASEGPDPASASTPEVTLNPV